LQASEKDKGKGIRDESRDRGGEKCRARGIVVVDRVHGDRLGHPLVPSIKLRTGSELVEEFATFKPFGIKNLEWELPRFENCPNGEMSSSTR